MAIFNSYVKLPEGKFIATLVQQLLLRPTHLPASRFSWLLLGYLCICSFLTGSVLLCLSRRLTLLYTLLLDIACNIIPFNSMLFDVFCCACQPCMLHGSCVRDSNISTGNKRSKSIEIQLLGGWVTTWGMFITVLGTENIQHPSFTTQ